MAFGERSVATDCVILVGHPHDEDDVEGGGRVVEELGHDRFHAYIWARNNGN